MMDRPFYRITLIVGPIRNLPGFGLRLAKIVGLLKHNGEDVRVEITYLPGGESEFVD